MDKYKSIEKYGFLGKVDIDFNLPRNEILKQIKKAKENKNIAIAVNYKDKMFLKKWFIRYNYLISDCGNYVVNLYNDYIKLSTKHVDGYHSFSLYDPIEKTMKKFYAHVLVAYAFIPRVDGKTEVDHIDRNRSHNYVSNLRWANRVEQLKNRSI